MPRIYSHSSGVTTAIELLVASVMLGGKIAVKVINHYGDEVLKVIALK